MATPVSYNNEKVVTGEVEYPATDPASGAFFQPDFKKNEDLKMMLDGSKDSLKLEAMKRIIGMIAKGRDASDLFPAVVKNVVSKNIEVKKLVYVYLVRYAEEQQDLALLSISTFQRALKDPNQLIRASALRVLSSIRVSMIVPIVMLAIKDSASDMSPYVRKTAAHAIPKLYSLDPEQKEELVEIIERLLSDKAPLVVGSAAMAFTEVCPERLSLLHNCYRKLCGLLADVDEWGQCALLNVLTVYAKTHFPDPNKETTLSTDSSDKEFYSDEEEKRSCEVALDPDLKLLLRAAKPLLQSRSAAVVVCVARLFYHCANSQELPPMVKALIRLLRAPVEVQSVVLNSIASLTVSKKYLFEPYIKSFYVRMSDPSHIKLLKLEILTNLTSDVNASQVLRELQTYVTSCDRVLAANAIQAIGRAALAVPSETQSCLNASLHLLSSKHEWAVCEAVLVVKRVLGSGDASARAALVRATKLLRADRLSGKAKAAALWLVSEHGAKHPRAAAVLAHMVHTFADQDELVKLQLLTLMAKVSITQPDTIPLAKYMLQLARYDANYDVRDRARMLVNFVSEDEKIRAKAARVLLAKKPPPNCDSQFTDRQQFTLGTLSHYIGSSAVGYLKLPESPEKVIAADLRDTDTKLNVQEVNISKNKSFYSEPESSGSGSDDDSESDSSDDDGSDDESGSGSDDKSKGSSDSGTSDSESSSDEDSSESSQDDDDDDKKPQPDINMKTPPKEAKSNNKSNLELLLELDSVATTLPTMTPTCGGFYTPTKQTDDETITPCASPFTPIIRSELLAKVSCSNLRATSRFTRQPHLYSNKMAAIEIEFFNFNKEPVNNIRVNKKTLSGTRAIHDFAPIPVLDSNASANVIFGVDFSDSIQPIEFTIACSLGEFSASITPPVGELMRSVIMSQNKWDKEQNKLRGMNECDKKCKVLPEVSTINQKILETANVAIVTDTGDLLRYAGQMLCSQELVLLSVKINENDCLIRANCGNMAVASMLANQIARILEANS